MQEFLVSLKPCSHVSLDDSSPAASRLRRGPRCASNTRFYAVGARLLVVWSMHRTYWQPTRTRWSQTFLSHFTLRWAQRTQENTFNGLDDAICSCAGLNSSVDMSGSGYKRRTSALQYIAGIYSGRWKSKGKNTRFFKIGRVKDLNNGISRP